MQHPKRKRGLSLLLSLIMTLTSTITFTLPTHASSIRPMKNNNMVWGSSDYVANLDTVNNEDDCSRPQYQMVRISMIKQGSDSNNPDGFTVADGKISFLV